MPETHFADSPHAGPWIVLKFGGTSVLRRHRWDTIGRLAKQRADDGDASGVNTRVLVVVSALSGVTNELQAIADGREIDSRITALVERHRDFCAELDLDADQVLGERLAILRALGSDPRAMQCSLDWQAEVLAQGELLSSTLGAAYLRAQGLDFGWCDARDWLSAVSLPNASAWAQRLSVNCRYRDDADFSRRFSKQPTRMLISQGFIARHADGHTAILGRGGSDTSAAYFGALLKARRVEIWTDVPGMFSANPREVPDARLLARLDYAEAQEIAAALVKAIARRTILSWEGVGDAEGNVIAPDDATIDALFDLWPIYEAFNERFIARWLLLGEEGNGSAPLPTGTSAGAPDIARPVPGAAPTAPPG